MLKIFHSARYVLKDDENNGDEDNVNCAWNDANYNYVIKVYMNLFLELYNKLLSHFLFSK